MKHPRYYLKKLISKFMCITEFCQDCGVKQPLVWTTSDNLWKEIYGSPYGVLCPKCFDSRCFEKDKLLVWEAKLWEAKDAEASSPQ